MIYAAYEKEPHTLLVKFKTLKEALAYLKEVHKVPGQHALGYVNSKDHKPVALEEYLRVGSNTTLEVEKRAVVQQIYNEYVFVSSNSEE